MKKLLFFVAFLVLGISLSAQEKVTFMPSFSPQAQSAGFYAAKEKGFYSEEGLDVDIRHISANSSKSAMQFLVAGDVDIVCSYPISSILANSEGFRVRNVMQIMQSSGLMIVSHTPISSLKDLDGKKVGIWKNVFSVVCDMCGKVNGMNVNPVYFKGGIDLFLSGAVDATLAMCYNEYYSLLEAMGELAPECILRFSDYGYDIPEDGLYCLDSYVSAHPETVDKFVRATKKGWDWCIGHPDEALDIVMEYTARNGILTSRYHQRSMLEDVFRLMVNVRSGEVDYAPVPKNVFDELAGALVESGYLSETINYEDFKR